MIASMTGFANVTRPISAERVGGTLSFEIKSVNSRFLDLSFRFPDELRALEMPLREMLSKELARGKVECRAGWALQANDVNETLDMERMQRLLQLANEVQGLFADSRGLSTADVLRWPGVVRTAELDWASLFSEFQTMAVEAVQALKAVRNREGARLAELVKTRTTAMRELVARADPLIPAAQQAFAEKARAKLIEVVGSAEDERIRQELTLYAVRTDVAEELGRLKVHLDEVDRVVSTRGQAGKRLDFLMQELNREANTLGSKSVSTDVSAIAMELKLLIEQIREQVQNIE
ncbi:MAG: YicC family protein [Rhodocyclaceae bacterium]|nr:YicC family protein [Rhodocyclaceae bacterium]